MFLNEDDKILVGALVTMLRHLQKTEGRTREECERFIKEAEEQGAALSAGNRRVIVEALDIVYRDEATA